MKKPVVFVVRLDDMSKVASLSPVSLVNRLARVFTDYCTDRATDLIVYQKNIMSMLDITDYASTGDFKLVFATKGKHMNADNRQLVQVSII